MIELFYTAADNSSFLALCNQANWFVGLRSDKYPCHLATSIQFIDTRYTAPNFSRHLAQVQRFRPRYATVPDLSDREVSRKDVLRALHQAELLAPYCDTVLFVPKISGQISLLPSDAAIGFSLPTRYGAAQYSLGELEGHRVHLLGGSPHAQMSTHRYLSCFADVKSLDCNMHQRMSGYGKYWKRGHWVRHPNHGSRDANTSFECVFWSLSNIRQAWLSYFHIS